MQEATFRIMQLTSFDVDCCNFGSKQGGVNCINSQGRFRGAGLDQLNQGLRQIQHLHTSISCIIWKSVSFNYFNFELKNQSKSKRKPNQINLRYTFVGEGHKPQSRYHYFEMRVSDIVDELDGGYPSL